MPKKGERLNLSPFQTVLKFIIQFVFYVFEKPCPGIHYPSVNQRTLVVVFLPALLTDIVFRISSVLVNQDCSPANGAIPFHKSCCLLIYPSLNHPVKIRVIYEIEILVLYVITEPGEPFQTIFLQF